jgi:hypothetical protein
MPAMNIRSSIKPASNFAYKFDIELIELQQYFYPALLDEFYQTNTMPLKNFMLFECSGDRFLSCFWIGWRTFKPM